ncbi:hypothetical protein LPB140_00160 [Sphingorhabdus lutea]|uniref:Lipoprotein n=1 Tax=Sphingorhabdus lutea TaxID=1913578 RepID=A0A1L3J8S2_9SPHN|nr:hypothetical protein [Sphingorhabdus lutea]APG61514.1 hypothetical protein LPB140_00160 [Sphingorhabdus lutea]
MKYNIIFLPLLTLSCSAVTHKEPENDKLKIEMVAKSKTEIAFKYDTKNIIYCIPSSDLDMNAFLVASKDPQKGKLEHTTYSNIANFTAPYDGASSYITIIYGKGEIILERANNVESQTVYLARIARCANLKTNTAPIDGYIIEAVFQN